MLNDEIFAASSVSMNSSTTKAYDSHKINVGKAETDVEAVFPMRIV